MRGKQSISTRTTSAFLGSLGRYAIAKRHATDPLMLLLPPQLKQLPPIQEAHLRQAGFVVLQGEFFSDVTKRKQVVWLCS